MKKLICFILVLSIAGTASAEWSKVGSSGAQFLKIGVGSRYQGMGEASVATVNDVYSMHWNPAGLVEIDNAAVGFTNVNWLLDVKLNYVGFARYFEDIGTFGASATVLSMDDQETTTLQEQNGTGEFYSASSYALGLSYARQITAKFAFGATFKYIGERLDNETSSGFAFDFGTMLYTGFRSLRLGMSIANMGPELQFAGSDLDVTYDESSDDQSDRAVGASVKTTAYELPMTFRVGAAYDVEFGPKSILTVSGEVIHPNDVSQQGAVGAEFNFNEKFFLRSGYMINYDEQGLTLGGGLSTRISGDTQLLIDYAWQDFGRLESTQRFSVGFAF
ncbi:MAG: PorV/PorQ family protein [bacterium]